LFSVRACQPGTRVILPSTRCGGCSSCHQLAGKKNQGKVQHLFVLATCSSMTFLQRPGGDESYGVADLRRCLSLGSSALVVLPHMLQRTYVKKGRARRAVGHVCVAQYNVVVVLLAILCTSSSSIIVVAKGSRVPCDRGAQNSNSNANSTLTLYRSRSPARRQRLS